MLCQFFTQSIAIEAQNPRGMYLITADSFQSLLD